MFKAAHEADPRNTGAINNLGDVDFEQNRFEDAAIKFLDALEIKPTDEEALCNLAMALKKTKHLDYAQLAFEEAVNTCPANTSILANYMFFLVEQKKFSLFAQILKHATRIMEKHELDTILQLHDDYKAAIDGTEGKVLPEDEPPQSTRSALDSVDDQRMKTALKSFFGKKTAALKKPELQTIIEDD